MTEARVRGIIFPNLHEQGLPELVSHRAMASLPFAGRYRMIDFALSGMATAGIRNVGVIVQKNYQSLMDHLGSGRAWDLSRKHGGLMLFPPYARDGRVYRGRIEALASILPYLEKAGEELVVMSDCDVAFSLNYKDLIRTHIRSGADVTIVYGKTEMTEGLSRDNTALVMDKQGVVKQLRINEYQPGVHALSLNVCILSRKLLVNVVHETTVCGQTRFFADYLQHNLDKLKVMGYEFDGYRARIYDMQSYFQESLRLLDAGSIEGLFTPRYPILTKVRDEAPVRYAIGAKVEGSLVADGCIVEGEVENCVLFRSVRVAKNTKLKNCVIMQGTEIGPGAVMENVVTDKDVVIGAGQQLHGAANFPVFIAKGCKVL